MPVNFYNSFNNYYTGRGKPVNKPLDPNAEANNVSNKVNDVANKVNDVANKVNDVANKVNDVANKMNRIG